MKIGFHASHEQFPPSHLLELVRQAEHAGFTSVLSSDHFHPWSDQQGHSGFAWSWLGAAMLATSLEFGIVNAPGQRYHPAIIAQATATLAEMFPGRFYLALGSGQALNENITGQKWPQKEVRNKRLEESVQIIQQLWEGDYVNYTGEINIQDAKLFTTPTSPIPIYGAAISSKTAGWVSGWADGLITVAKPMEKMQKVVSEFRRQHATGPMVVKVQISYDSNDGEARKGAWEQWKNNIFASSVLSELNTPKQFDEIGKTVRKEDMEEHVIISSKPRIYLEAIKSYIDLGFEKIIIHNVNKKQSEFIAFFGKEILPHFKMK